MLCVALSVLYLWNDSYWAFEQKFPQQVNLTQHKMANVELILADGKRVLLDGSDDKFKIMAYPVSKMILCRD